jgi:adhesin transport system membrane fusion protein
MNNEKNRYQSGFEKIGRLLDKLGIPASRFIEKAFARWVAFNAVDQRDWVTEADWAKLQQEPVRARLLLRVIAYIMLMLFIWAAVAKIDEVARGEGKVIPSSQLQVIQSFDGGVVEEVFVKEGQIVNKGDLLLRIDPTRFIATYRENRAEYLSLQARAARLGALTSNTAFQLPKGLEEESEIATHERNLYSSNQKELDEQLSIAKSQLTQREEELNEVQAKLAQVSRALALSQQELNVTKPLLASGAISEVEILRLEGDVSLSLIHI